MSRGLQEKRIKSANRVLELLELFSNECQALTVMDVARALDMPQSSSSELLSCLVVQGYLQRDRVARTYSPTARVALLGAWVQPGLFREGRLLPMMDEIAQESGFTSLLGSIVGVGLRHVHAAHGHGSVAFDGQCGGSLLHSPMGKVLLSVFDWEIVRKLVHRLNAEGGYWPPIRINEFLPELDQIRAKGFAHGCAGDGANAIVSVLLPQVGDQQLSLGIAMPRDELEGNLQGYVRLLRGAVSAHLGPVLASDIERPRYARVM